MKKKIPEIIALQCKIIHPNDLVKYHSIFIQGSFIALKKYL